MDEQPPAHFCRCLDAPKAQHARSHILGNWGQSRLLSDALADEHHAPRLRDRRGHRHRRKRCCSRSRPRISPQAIRPDAAGIVKTIDCGKKYLYLCSKRRSPHGDRRGLGRHGGARRPGVGGGRRVFPAAEAFPVSLRQRISASLNLPPFRVPASIFSQATAGGWTWKSAPSYRCSPPLPYCSPS